MTSLRSGDDDGMASPLTASRRQWVQQELDALHDAFRNESPLRTIPSASPEGQSKPEGVHTRKWVESPRTASSLSASPLQIGQYVEGQRLPLTKLTEALAAVLFQKDPSESVDLKIIVCDVATRKYYGLKEGREDVDFTPFDDVSRGPFWFWELRSLSLLPDGLRGTASRTRQKHKQMQDRLMALSAVIRLNELEQGSKSKRTTAWQARVHKAIEKLERIPDLQSINERFSDFGEEEFVQQVFRISYGLRGVMVSCMQVGKRMKRDVAVEDAPSMQKETKKEEKVTPATSCGSVKNLKSAQRMLKDFFPPPLKGEASEVQEREGLRVAGRIVLACPENKRLIFERGDVDSLEAQLMSTSSAEHVNAEFLNRCQRIRLHPNRHQSLIYGAPATWARQPDYTLNYEAECEKLFGSEWRCLEISPVRMKYLWFSSDSDCPPYFGPLAKLEGVHPRNPFFQAPSLDYDHLFDEGWEEEPDGESLSVEEEDDEDKCLLSDEDEAFIVEDGYLSEDEGIGGEMETDEGGSDSGTSLHAEKGLDIVSEEGTDVSQIEARMRHSHKSGKPMIFTQLDISTPIGKDWIRGDAVMLKTLKAIPLTTEKITLHKKT